LPPFPVTTPPVDAGRRRSLACWGAGALAFAAGAALPTAAGTTGATGTQGTTPHPRHSARRFELHGHRGARGLAPENTIAGFERALIEGVDALEMDTFLSADDQFLVHHDPRPHPDIARDATGRWLEAPGPLLRSLTAAQARRWDVGRLRPDSALARQFPDQQPVDGQRIPTLVEVLAWATRRSVVDAGLRFNIELKMHPRHPEFTGNAETLARVLLATLDAAGVRSRCMVQGFDWSVLRVLHRRAPELPLAFLSVQQVRADTVASGAWSGGLRLADHRGSVPRMVAAAGGRVWSPNYRDLDGARVREAQALGLQVLPWTLNEPADMRRMIELGVDGLITDYPDRVRAVMAAAGLQPPAPLPVPVPAPEPKPAGAAQSRPAGPRGTVPRAPADRPAGRP
jgi:glycerophosphoryl diester phosphodiesterase